MDLSLFDYLLPQEKIAHAPMEPRTEGKLLVVDRDKKNLEDKKIKDLLGLFSENDVLVFNETKVIPARLKGLKSTGGKVEILLVKQLGSDLWQALSKPGLKVGQEIQIEAMKAKVEERKEDTVVLRFNYSGDYLKSRIEDFGKTPLPPYIHSQKSERELRKIYQTVYAKHEGSVAAPTAGLHFTQELLRDLKAKGVQMEYVTLSVGLGTFRGVKTEKIEEHQMHGEEFNLSEETAQRLSQAKKEGKRIIAVGTTTVRVLESCADAQGELTSQSGETKIYIYPPYKFKFVDGLLTNFHLPKSTLLMLVAAFVSSPNTNEKFEGYGSSLLGKAYEHAKDNDYRFFSFGDAMLIIDR